MNEFERARRKYEKSYAHHKKFYPDYGKTIHYGKDVTPKDVTPMDATPKEITPVEVEPPKKVETPVEAPKKVDTNGYVTIQVRCAELDVLLKYRVRSMRNNSPGPFNEANLREVFRQAMASKFGNVVENA